MLRDPGPSQCPDGVAVGRDPGPNGRLSPGLLVLTNPGPIQCPSGTALALLPAVQGVVRGALVLRDPGPTQRTFVIVPGGTSGYGLVNPGPTQSARPRSAPVPDSRSCPPAACPLQRCAAAPPSHLDDTRTGSVTPMLRRTCQGTGPPPDRHGMEGSRRSCRRAHHRVLAVALATLLVPLVVGSAAAAPGNRPSVTVTPTVINQSVLRRGRPQSGHQPDRLVRLCPRQQRRDALRSKDGQWRQGQPLRDRARHPERRPSHDHRHRARDRWGQRCGLIPRSEPRKAFRHRLHEPRWHRWLRSGQRRADLYLVDGNADGIIDVGDPINLGSYPLDLGAAGFGKFQATPLTSPPFATAAGLSGLSSRPRRGSSPGATLVNRFPKISSFLAAAQGSHSYMTGRPTVRAVPTATRSWCLPAALANPTRRHSTRTAPWRAELLTPTSSTSKSRRRQTAAPSGRPQNAPARVGAFPCLRAAVPRPAPRGSIPSLTASSRRPSVARARPPRGPRRQANARPSPHHPVPVSRPEDASPVCGEEAFG